MPKLTRNEFIELVKKYQLQIASPEEIEFIEEYYRYFESGDKASTYLSPQEKELLQKKLSQNILSKIEELEQISAASNSRNPGVFRLFMSRSRRIAAAVVFILMLGSGIYLFRKLDTPKEKAANTASSARFKNDVSPGGDKAILTLADGTKINLDSVHNGMLGKQGMARVQKFQSGMLAYHSPNITIAVQNAPILYNTVTTPRGGQYQVVLADGTQVWLNAASSLHFPTSFTGKQRIVELTGEAYFEVAHLTKGEKEKIPFIVKIITPSGNGGEVEVLGTHFNINAYNDESAVKTTLLEGSVKIIHAGSDGLLVPGQQAQLNNNGELKILSDADLDEAVAWRKGMFQFKKADIKTIMRQVARWYDVDIEYQSNVDEKFYAEISRNTNASNVFKMLEETGGVHFRIEGKKVVVMP